MRKRKLSLHVLVSLIGTLVLAVGSIGQDISSTTVLPGVRSNVVVRRDARHIPYIEAKSEADMYFVQGYVTASDRLWQMDLMRRLARGETAEIFGSAALEQDKRWRRFNFSRIADENLKYLSPDLIAALDNYAKGVNAYLAKLSDETMPLEFRILQYKPRPWTPSDTIVIGKILSDALSTTWPTDLLRASLLDLSAEKFADLTNQTTDYDLVLFGSDRKPAAVAPRPGLVPSGIALDQADREMELRKQSLTLVGLYAEDLAASNNWVISGKLTADGKPILANDPHLQPTAPGIWYMTELDTPGMHAAGVTFPGVPGIVLGHNENIAWGATNVGPDVQDLYFETFNADGKYKTPSGWVDPVVRKEIIKTRSSPLSPATKDVEFDVTETRHGPIIVEENGRRYALKWTAFDPKNNEFEAFVKINHAANWDEFKNSLRLYGGSAQNFVYADVKGNIGWYAAGRIPLRKTGDGALPYDGSTDDGEWTGFIPFDQLPNLYDPPNGIIVTANQRTVGASYRYTQFIRDAAAPWRARRIYDLLSSKKNITMDDVRDVQLDVFNIPLKNLADQVVKLGSASPETIAVFKNWDGRMTPDSQGALLANEIRGCLATTIADENKPATAAVIRERILDKAVKDQSQLWLPKRFTSYKQFIESCDATVRQNLSASKTFGTDPAGWTWGKVSVSRFPHPLASAPLIGAQFAIPQVPIPGSGQTPNVGSSVSMRLIASPGNWDATSHVIPLGESGDARSPFFRDQFPMWLNDRPPVFPFSEKAVEAAAKSTVVYLPD